MPPTLVLTPRFTDDAQALWRAALRLGWNVERLDSWKVPAHLRDLEEPVLYIEGLLGPTVAKAFGIELTQPPESWLPDLPGALRGREVRLATLEAARLLETPAFVKPPNDKSFPAAVYAPHELPTDFDPLTPVLIQEVVQWTVEIRCFVLDREVTTMSIYLRNGELQSHNGFNASDTETAEAHAFVDQVLADASVPLPKACVLDVGVIADRGWAVIEQNSAWGAGIYGCDPEKVLRVIREAGASATTH